jgi:hypothetical protein
MLLVLLVDFSSAIRLSCALTSVRQGTTDVSRRVVDKCEGAMLVAMISLLKTGRRRNSRGIDNHGEQVIPLSFSI